MERTTQNMTKKASTPTPAPILVASGHLLMFDVTVVVPVVGDTEVSAGPLGLVSVGLTLPPVAVAGFEPVTAAVGACVNVAMPN
jgi:hypothetical protein